MQVRDSTPLPASEAALLWQMIRVASPVVVTQYTVVIMQVVDAWMLGSLGTNELAAIASSGLLILFLVSFGTGFMSSIITTVSQECGRRGPNTAIQFGWHGVYASLLLAIPFLMLWPFADKIFLFYGHEPQLASLEGSYFRISLLSIFPQLLSVSLSYYFIGLQETRLAMLGSLLGMLLNALFGYAMIFGALGCPQLGFPGAAWATVTASFLQAGFLLFVFKRRNRHQGVAKWSSSHFARLCKLGFPAGLHSAVDILSWGVILTYLIGFFGAAHLAAATVLVRCVQIAFLPADGFAATMMSAVGQSLGAKEIGRAREQARLAFKVVATYMVGMGILFYLTREPLMSLFTDDVEVIHIGVHAIVFVCFFQIFDALNLTYINALYAAGDTLWPSIVNIILCLVVFVGGGRFLTEYYPHLESYGVWLVATVYILAQGLCFYWRWRSGGWLQFVER